MYGTNQFRNGLKIELDNEPFVIVEFQHVKPGKGGAFVRTKLKSLITGNVLERTFRSGEKVGKPQLEEKEMQYLYSSDNEYHVMDMETYEQIFLTEDQLGTSKNYLQENVVVKVLFYNGQPIGVDVPIFVELRIAETDPGVRGDTASGGTKPAILETGATVQVPLFLNVGDVVKVDTRTGGYIERVQR
ncbi:elongation factor P [Candidatus Vecturithrix granuli]|uniref:Elongation factor P n=1 Tax=Vecturithrix granuli TaxID=1499967 RepID=A0A081BY09_VECG1|nr:elongation factor P [Candidatus Vecturithrix granuli]